jgi:hypothetical protein
VWRQAARFQTDDVCDLDAGERPAAAGEVAGAEDFEVVGGGVAGKGQVLLALAEDLVNHRGRQAVAAEAADGEVVTVADQPGHGVGDSSELVGQRPGLAGEKLAGPVGGRVGVERAAALERGVH